MNQSSRALHLQNIKLIKKQNKKNEDILNFFGFFFKFFDFFPLKISFNLARDVARIFVICGYNPTNTIFLALTRNFRRFFPRKIGSNNEKKSHSVKSILNTGFGRKLTHICRD